MGPWQLQYPVTYPQRVPAALGPQEAVQMITQRARDALNDQRETVRRALHHQEGQLPSATRQYGAAARQKLVCASARKNEAHKENVQIPDRQLYQEDARFFSKNTGICTLDLPGSKTSS